MSINYGGMGDMASPTPKPDPGHPVRNAAVTLAVMIGLLYAVLWLLDL